MDIETDYRINRFPTLTKIAKNLQTYIEEQLSGVERIDSVRTRAKSPDRFAAKAAKITHTGDARYEEPYSAIQDQIGGRITVFYLSDVEIIKSRIERYFKYIELQDKRPANDSEFGYFGVHFILKLPDDIIPDDTLSDIVPEFFELQIRTLFQHAWSEAHHDLGYKTVRDLNSDEKRKVAFSAAQAWGADIIFQELAQHLVVNDNDLEITE